MDILMIEDCFPEVKNLRLLIEQETDLTTELCTADEAIDLVQKFKPKYIQMDGLDGKCFPLIKEIKEILPDAEYIVYSEGCRSIGFSKMVGLYEAKCFVKGSQDFDLVDYIKSVEKSVLFDT